MKGRGLGLLGNGREDCDELIALMIEILQFPRADDIRFNEQLEPVGGFIKLLDANSDDGDELCFGPGALGFAEIGSN
jgi:hypothetical protein